MFIDQPKLVKAVCYTLSLFPDPFTLETLSSGEDYANILTQSIATKPGYDVKHGAMFYIKSKIDKDQKSLPVAVR